MTTNHPAHSRQARKRLRRTRQSAVMCHANLMKLADNPKQNPHKNITCHIPVCRKSRFKRTQTVTQKGTFRSAKDALLVRH